jgi:hypothetical protein
MSSWLTAIRDPFLRVIDFFPPGAGFRPIREVEAVGYSESSERGGVARGNGCPSSQNV